MDEPRKIIQLQSDGVGFLFALCGDGTVLSLRKTDDARIEWSVVSEDCPQPGPVRSAKYKNRSAGGKARWANTTPEQRKEFGRKMAMARYDKKAVDK